MKVTREHEFSWLYRFETPLNPIGQLWQKVESTLRECGVEYHAEEEDGKISSVAFTDCAPEARAKLARECWKAMRFDCGGIMAVLNLTAPFNGTSPTTLKGYVILYTTTNLDVTAEYTSRQNLTSGVGTFAIVQIQSTRFTR